MSIKTLLLGKLFKETAKDINKTYVNITPDGSCFVINPILFDADRIIKAASNQALIEEIVKSVDKSERKEFLDSKDVKEGTEIFYTTFCKG